MKFSVTKNIKLWITLVISLVVVGLAIFGVFGLNQNPDYTNSYEAVVSMDTQTSISTQQFTELCEEYFDENDIDYVDSVQQIDGPIGKYSLVYKFTCDVKLDKADMKAFLDDKITDDELVINVDYNQVVGYDAQNSGKIILAISVAAVLITLYLFIMNGFKSGISVLISSVVSALLFISIISLARIPAAPFVGIFGCIAFLLNAMLSTGVLSSVKEQVRLNQAVELTAERLTSKQIADKAACANLLKVALAFAGLLLAGILFVALGNVYVTFMGLHLIVCAVTSVFSTLFGTTIVWSLLN